ncbi:hypothetical protein N802_17705 [Knoellia sinensis KCTC 19936]|uniref:PDGLE domain-containing protein n=1 Tax=Knoellia sinensis KCTC 19936 TaxID=1385520 RepID=A0A0A0J9C8_9MICO|nr:PDGLE domain-containing protein [Knoellia sinensis]KGN32637.1 hypothetical protein N802_17705 [Knoellia sinensis KCTC 19936]
MSTTTGPQISTRRLVIAGLVISLILAGVVSLWASGNPDGLEFVAEKLGFVDTAGEHATGESPLADYGVAGVANERLSGGLAGILGVVAVAVIAFGLMFVLRKRGTRNEG